MKLTTKKKTVKYYRGLDLSNGKKKGSSGSYFTATNTLMVVQVFVI